MFERVPVEGSPISATPAEPQSAGTAAVQRMAPTLQHLLSPTPRALHHRPARDEDDRLRAGSAALQRAVADRRMIARDQDPGPPEASEMKGVTCGTKSDGTPYCTVETGKGPLEVDPKSVPSPTSSPPKGRPPASCPTERWNWFSNKCCPEGQFFDQAKRSCASPSKEQPIKPFELPSSPPLPPSSPEPFVVPPAPDPPQKGDFPLPDESRAYA